MYRTTKRAQQAVKAREQIRLNNPAPNYPQELPEIRREIIIIDHDFERKEYRMELRKTNRIDCYDCYINGQLWKQRIGWSRVQEWIRKAFPRVSAL